MIWIVLIFLFLLIIGMVFDNSVSLEERRKEEEKRIVEEVLRRHEEGMKNNWGRK